LSADTTSSAFVSRAPKLGFVGSFDGIRGVFVLMVLLQHAYPTATSFSSVVDVFFVISGFLITTLLFEEHAKTDHISLRNFYIRRALRLLPGLIVVLVVGFIGVWIIQPSFAHQAGLESLAALFYVHNIFYNPILGFGQYLGQMWSLSVEEQFYFIVSILMFVAVPRKWIKQVFVGLLAFYIFVNVARLMGHMGPAQAWFDRPDACAIGMCLAIVNAWLPKDLAAKTLNRMKVVAWVALFGLTFSLFSSSEVLMDKFGFGWAFTPSLPKRIQDAAKNIKPGHYPSTLVNQAMAAELARVHDQWYWVRWGFTLGSLSSAILVLCLVRLGPTFSINRLLSFPVLRYLGRASYALYISHYQLYILVGGSLVGGPKMQALEKIVLALIVGLAIHQWIEKPALKLKGRFSFLSTSPKPTMATE
jgi:peptidoglycan/LPS O-acetylase OafA/YrhL